MSQTKISPLSSPVIILVPSFILQIEYTGAEKPMSYFNNFSNEFSKFQIIIYLSRELETITHLFSSTLIFYK